MCQECQKEMSRPARIAIVVLLLMIAVPLFYFTLQPGGLDIGRLMYEQRVKERQELIKKHSPPPKPERVIVT